MRKTFVSNSGPGVLRKVISAGVKPSQGKTTVSLPKASGKILRTITVISAKANIKSKTAARLVSQSRLKVSAVTGRKPEAGKLKTRGGLKNA